MEEKEAKDTCDDGQFLDLSDINSEPKNYLVRNHFYFNDEINSDTARALIINLHELALSIVDESLKVGSIPCPIELHINSPGGSLTNALQIVQVIKDIQSGKACKIGDALVPVKINTYGEGAFCSGASLIHCVGSKRYMSKYSLCLIHPMKSIDGNFKTVEEQRQELDNNELFNRVYKDVYLEHSNLTEEQLNNMMKIERYYTPQELLSFGLVDEIY